MGSLELPRTQEISIFLAYHPWGVFVCILILLFSQSQNGCCLPGIASIIQEERRVKGKRAKESCQLFFPEKQQYIGEFQAIFANFFRTPENLPAGTDFLAGKTLPKRGKL